MSGTLGIQEGEPLRPRLRDALNGHMVLIFAVALFTNVSMYMVHPFFVIYFKESMGFSTPEAGLLAALPFLSAMLFGVVGGYLSDRAGLLRMFIIAMAFHAVCIGAVAFVHSFVAVTLLMLVSGMAMPVMSSGISGIVNESAREEHRGLLQNYLYWVNNLGVVLGLLVSAELLHAGHSNEPLIFVGIIRLMLCVVLLLFFRTKVPEFSDGSSPVPATSRPTMAATLKCAATDRALLYAALTFVLLMIIESQLDVTIPLYFIGHFKNGVTLFGPIVAINSVILVAFQPLAITLLSKRRPLPMFATGALCTGVGFALGGAVGTVWAWVVGMVLYSTGEVVWSTKFNDVLGELPTPGNTALYFSVIRTAIMVAMFIGMTFGGIAYRSVSAPILFGSMIVIAAITIPLFRLATTAYKRRTETVTGNVDVVVAE